MQFANKVRQWWQQSLRHRLLVSSITTLLLFLTLLGYFALRAGRAGVLHEVTQRNDQLAMLIAQHLSVQFNNIWRNVQLFTYQLDTTETQVLQAQAMLELRKAAPLTYRTLYLFDEGRLHIHLADPLVELLTIQDGREVLNRPPISPPSEVLNIYKDVQQTGELVLSTTRIVGTDHIPILYIGIPTYAATSRAVTQVMVAEIDLRDTWRRIDEIHIGQTGHAFVVSQEGTIIAHPDRSYIGRPLAPDLSRVLENYTGRTKYVDPFSGRVMLASYSPVNAPSGWSVVVEQERNEALGFVDQIAFITLAVLIIAGSMATFSAIYTARSITEPIQSLAQATQTVTHTGHLNHTIEVSGNDEVSQLATAFNQMILSLRQREREIRKLNADLEQRVEERTAQLEATNRELEAFSYSVSHDLRAPLRRVRGFSQALLEDYGDQLDAQGQDYTHRIRAATARMEQLIDALLTLSRVTRGELQRASVDLSAFASDIAAELQTTAPHRQASFNIREDIIGQGDPGLLRIVLENLLGNAWKFTEKCICAKIEFNILLDIMPTVYYVRDNGLGFDMAYADELFIAFHRLHQATDITGTGIGLATVQRIIHRHGGRVWAEGRVGHGATFYFTLEAVDR